MLAQQNRSFPTVEVKLMTRLILGQGLHLYCVISHIMSELNRSSLELLSSTNLVNLTTCSIPEYICHRWRRDTRRPAPRACSSVTKPPVEPEMWDLYSFRPDWGSFQSSPEPDNTHRLDYEHCKLLRLCRVPPSLINNRPWIIFSIPRLVRSLSLLTNLLKLSSEQFMSWKVPVQILERSSYEMLDSLSSLLSAPSLCHLCISSLPWLLSNLARFSWTIRK